MATEEQLRFIKRHVKSPYWQERIIKQVDAGGLSNCYVFVDGAYGGYVVLGYGKVGGSLGTLDFPYEIARTRSKSYALKLLKEAVRLGICKNVFRLHHPRLKVGSRT